MLFRSCGALNHGLAIYVHLQFLYANSRRDRPILCLSTARVQPHINACAAIAKWAHCPIAYRRLRVVAICVDQHLQHIGAYPHLLFAPTIGLGGLAHPTNWLGRLPKNPHAGVQWVRAQIGRHSALLTSHSITSDEPSGKLPVRVPSRR